MKIEDLPEDITTEILSRLPAESVIRCKRVLKTWYVLLTNPDFVAKHLAYQHHSGGDKNKHVFLKRCVDGDSMFILSAENIDDPQVVDLPSTFQLCGKGIVLIGHCDGLIALGNAEDGIIVINPATREFKILPDSSFGPIPYKTIVTYDEHDGMCQYSTSNTFIGFGYDCKRDDYKLVRAVTFYWIKEIGCGKQIRRVEVFCVRTGSSWREIDVVLDCRQAGLIGDSHLTESYFDGACYWWAEDDETHKNLLLCFHMADEVFIKIPVPTTLGSPLGDDSDISNTYYEYWGNWVGVGVYKDEMALYVYNDGVAQDQIAIWVMKEFGVEDSWSKQLTLKLPGGGCHHLGFWNGTDEEEFLYADRDGEVGICDGMESKRLSLPGGIGGRWSGVPYMKTIVSLLH